MHSIAQLLLGLPLLIAASSLIQRQEPKAVTADYEDYKVTGGTTGVSKIEFPTAPYKDLAYTFLFFENLAATSMVPIAKPDGKKGIVGITGSTISIPPNSKVKSFKPTKISLMIFITGGTSVNAPVPGNIQITATKADGTAYDVFPCDITLTQGNLENTGLVQDFDLPGSWGEVVSMSFKITTTTGQQATDTLQQLKDTFGTMNVVGGGVGAAGSTAFIADNLVYTENCVTGSPSTTDGRCT